MVYLMRGFLMNVMVYVEYNKLDYKDMKQDLENKIKEIKNG